MAWAALLTEPSYLVGVRALHASLRRTGTQHPFVVMVTDGVDDAARSLLESEGALVRELPRAAPDPRLEAHYANARFVEVWSKLGAWGLTEFDRLVVLDADMLVVAPMDELFDVELPDGGIAACHACRCNPNRIASYPASWKPENCFYTHCRGGDHVSEPGVEDYFNGGFLVIEPDAAVHEALMARLAVLDDLTAYQFAEQDFLNEVFEGRWRQMPYVYNALKTLPHQHPQLWRRSEVKNIHFIIDKPWERRPEPGDRYAALHQLWWDAADAVPGLVAPAPAPA